MAAAPCAALHAHVVQARGKDAPPLPPPSPPSGAGRARGGGERRVVRVPQAAPSGPLPPIRPHRVDDALVAPVVATKRGQRGYDPFQHGRTGLDDEHARVDAVRRHHVRRRCAEAALGGARRRGLREQFGDGLQHEDVRVDVHNALVRALQTKDYKLVEGTRKVAGRGEGVLAGERVVLQMLKGLVGRDGENLGGGAGRSQSGGGKRRAAMIEEGSTAAPGGGLRSGVLEGVVGRDGEHLRGHRRLGEIFEGA